MEDFQKRINRTKQIIQNETLETLEDLYFDLNYLSDHVLDNDLKCAKENVNMVIDHVKDFLEK